MSRNKLETPLFDAESVNVLSEDCLLGDVCITQWLETQYVLSSPLSMLIYIFCPDIQQFNSYFFKILQD